MNTKFTCLFLIPSLLVGCVTQSTKNDSESKNELDSATVSIEIGQETVNPYFTIDTFKSGDTVIKTIHIPNNYKI